MKIGWIEVLRKRYGEGIYNRMAQSALAPHHDVASINVGLDPYRRALYPVLLYRLLRLEGEKAVWVRNFDSVLTLPYDRTRGKNIALIFHVDFTTQSSPVRFIGKALERIFYRHLKRVEAIVTISKYWQDHFIDRGYTRVYRIYNAFETGQFDFNEEEIVDFKRRYHLEERPIFYLGNCQRIKGVVEAYEQLKGMEAHFVTSGRREVDLPVLNLDLEPRDYLLLLKAASVVIVLSRFREGWNRTAHEAMLCRTPVIGSGRGGMKELLEGGGQVVCEEVRDLKARVLYALDHPEMGERGYAFAKDFTTERFRHAWLEVIQEVYEQ